MNVTRRSVLRLAAGAGASLVMAAFDGLARPVQALAIAGVDDAVVGGVVLVLLTLAGYAVSAEVSQATLSAMGYSFSQFAADANNQGAAVTRAIADANNLGVEVQRAQAESAAQAIAAGTGAVGDWFADIAESGKIALDGVVNGVGAIPAALWGLVAEYQQAILSSYPTATSDSEFYDGSTVGALGVPVRVVPLEVITALFGSNTLPVQPVWGIMPSVSTGSYYSAFIGTGDVRLQKSGSDLYVFAPSGQNYYLCEQKKSTGEFRSYIRSGLQQWAWEGTPVVSDLVITGGVLPGVDVAADAPETYGAGYDKTILGTDAVYGPDGEVVSAGTIALPVDYPYVQLPYVDGLYGLGAGVIPGIMDVPISGETDVVVGTQSGVVSMPITQAVATDTSIAEVAEPSVPVVPPGTPDVGPWQPAYSLPFQEVWPFNMVYQFVSELSTLGGAS